MNEVKRYMATCDCMSEAGWGDYVQHSDYDALRAENERLRDDRDSFQRVGIRTMEELAALKAVPDGVEVVGVIDEADEGCFVELMDDRSFRLGEKLVRQTDHLAALSAVTAERDRLLEENKRLDLMVSQADFNYDQDRYRMAGLLRNALICLEQWNLKHPRLAKRGEEHSSEHTYRQIRAFLPEYREFDAAMAARSEQEEGQ